MMESEFSFAQKYCATVSAKGNRKKSIDVIFVVCTVGNNFATTKSF